MFGNCGKSRSRRSVRLGFVADEADGMGDVVELLAADLLKALPFFGELLVDLDRLLSHRLVRVFRAADQGEVVAGGDAFVPIGIEADAEHQSFLVLL